jgi:hypothetical protein
VLKVCDRELKAAEQGPANVSPEEIYWLRASRAEALFGLGRRDESQTELIAAKAAKPPLPDWMIEATQAQLKTLGDLLARR